MLNLIMKNSKRDIFLLLFLCLIFQETLVYAQSDRSIRSLRNSTFQSGSIRVPRVPIGQSSTLGNRGTSSFDSRDTLGTTQRGLLNNSASGAPKSLRNPSQMSSKNTLRSGNLKSIRGTGLRSANRSSSSSLRSQNKQSSILSRLGSSLRSMLKGSDRGPSQNRGGSNSPGRR